MFYMLEDLIISLLLTIILWSNRNKKVSCEIYFFNSKVQRWHTSSDVYQNEIDFANALLTQHFCYYVTIKKGFKIQTIAFKL